MSECVVYLIRNRLTKDFYVGATRRLTRRWSDHRAALSKGEHHAVRLQRAWNKYGPAYFEFFVAGVYAPADLLPAEQWWLDNAKCAYNSSRRASCPSLDADARAALSVKLKQVWACPERRAAARERGLKQRVTRAGQVATAATRAKLSDTHRSKNRVHEVDGKLWALKELSEHYGVHYGMLKDRVRAGWSAAAAVKTPKRKGGL